MRSLFYDLADRMKTSHPASVIEHDNTSFKATMAGVTVEVKKSGKSFTATTSGKEPVKFASQQEAEWHVSDELNAVWRDLETKKPRTSAGRSYDGGGGSGDEIADAVSDQYHEASSDDGDDE